jgi:HK97 family phage prohead protease
MTIERLSSRVHEVAEGGEPGSFTAIAASLGIANSASGPVRFTPEALRAHDGREVPLLMSHDGAQPLGIARFRFDPKRGLLADGRLALAIQSARETRSLLMAGALNAASVGFSEKRGRRENGVRVVTDCDISELSLVVSPADPAARVIHVHRSGPTIFDLVSPRFKAKAEHEMIRDFQRAAAAKHERGGGAW